MKGDINTKKKRALPRQPRGPFRSSLGKEWMLMSTYEEMMVLLTFVLVVLSVLEHENHKNSTSAPEK